jgi:O-antigen ligase
MGFWLSLIYISLLFISIGETFPVLAPYRLELIIGIAALLATVAGAFFVPGSYASRSRSNLQYVLMAAFTVFVLASWWPHRWLGGFFVGLYGFMPFAILFFIVGLGANTSKRLYVLRVVLLGTALYIVVHGLYDWFFIGASSPYVLSYNDPNGLEFRLQGLGILRDPNEYAQFLLALIPVLFVSWNRRGPAARYGLLLPIAVLMGYAIFLSHSRGALVGITLLLLLVLRRRFSLLVGSFGTAVVVSAMLVANFTAGRAISISGGIDRLNVWSEGLGMFKRSPLWGVGYNGFTEHFELTAHNSFLLCATELGLIGYFFWMGLIVVSIWQLRVIVKDSGPDAPDPDVQRWASTILLSIYVFLMTGFFLSDTYSPTLYVLLGMAAAIVSIDMQQRNKPLLPKRSNWGVWTAALCTLSIVAIWVGVRLRVF